MTTPAKPARERLSDADLRAFTQYHSPQAQAAAREALALRRALREVAKLMRDTDVAWPPLEDILARAIGSKSK